MKVKKAIATMREVNANVPIGAPSGVVWGVGDMATGVEPGATEMPGFTRMIAQQDCGRLNEVQPAAREIQGSV